MRKPTQAKRRRPAISFCLVRRRHGLEREEERYDLEVLFLYQSLYKKEKWR
jgi:hypothetical protein